ncbi:MAG: STAS domain-containing protein [Streptosporangiales bacterium]
MASQLLTVELLAGERAGWRLVGEIDISSRERFDDVLALLTGDRCGTDGLIHLDLDQLTFIDLAGTRSLIRAAQRLYETAAGHLALHNPPYALHRVAALLLDRLEIDGDGTLTLPVIIAP